MPRHSESNKVEGSLATKAGLDNRRSSKWLAQTFLGVVLGVRRQKLSLYCMDAKAVLTIAHGVGLLCSVSGE